MTQQEFEDALRTEFPQWAFSHKDDEIAGTRAEPCDCPIARWLKTKGVTANVCATHAFDNETHDVLMMTAEGAKFIKRIDSRIPGNHRIWSSPKNPVTFRRVKSAIKALWPQSKGN